MLDQWDPKSPWHDRRVRLAANLAIDRKAINQAITLGHSRLTYSIIPSTFDFYWQPPAYPFDPAQAKKLLAEAGYPNGFDAGDYYLDISYANVQEAIANYLQQVGIRTKLISRERAAHWSTYTDKKYKNLAYTASGAFGNAATRLETYVVTGGAYVYGSYPDIDSLFKDQAAELDRKKREALLHRIQQLMHEKVMSHPDVGAGLHQRPRPARAGVRSRADPRPRLLGALRGREAQAQVMSPRAVAAGARLLGALALVLAALGGCAGRDFTRPPADTLALGKTTEPEIRQRFGDPSRQGIVMRNGETMKSLSYGYASGAGSLAGGLTPSRGMGFYFWNGALVGHEFTSSFDDRHHRLRRGEGRADPQGRDDRIGGHRAPGATPGRLHLSDDSRQGGARPGLSLRPDPRLGLQPQVLPAAAGRHDRSERRGQRGPAHVVGRAVARSAARAQPGRARTISHASPEARQGA